MITKEEAIELAKVYLMKRKRHCSELNSDKVWLQNHKKVGYGTHADQIKDCWTVPYETEGYDGPISYFIELDAETGKVLFTIGPHNYMEDSEEEGFE